MKKIVIFILLVFLLTGCSAEVNVKIDEDTINQNFNINIPTNELKHKTAYLTLYNNFLNIEHSGELLANFKIKDKNDINNIDSTINYNILNYKVDYALLSCYDNYDISFTNNIFSLITKNFNCYDKYPMLESLTINIATDYEVQNHNADQVSGNIYTYNITKQNKKDINFSFIYKDSDLEDDTDITKNDQSMIIILSFIIIIIFSFILLFIFSKSKKNNKI